MENNLIPTQHAVHVVTAGVTYLFDTHLSNYSTLTAFLHGFSLYVVVVTMAPLSYL